MNPLPSDVHPDMPVLFVFLRYKFAKFEHFRICVAIPPTALQEKYYFTRHPVSHLPVHCHPFARKCHPIFFPFFVKDWPKIDLAGSKLDQLVKPM